MTGSDLVAEIPWIIFGLSLAAICLRLRRSRRFPWRPRSREAQPYSGDRSDRSAQLASTAEPNGNDHLTGAAQAPAQPAPPQPASPRPPSVQP
jgi:hypothetical protein